MPRNWDNLSPKYRERLSRSGITKSQYESGASLSKARGHAQTPEHPNRANSKPEYARYRNRKAMKQIKERVSKSIRDRVEEYASKSSRTGKDWAGKQTTEFWALYNELGSAGLIEDYKTPEEWHAVKNYY